MRPAPSRHGSARRPAPRPRPATPPAVYLLGASLAGVEEAAGLLEVRLGLRRLHPPAAAVHGCDLGWWRDAAACCGVVAVGAPCPRQAGVLAASGWTGVLAVPSPAPFICARRAAALLPAAVPSLPPAACGHGVPGWSHVLGIPADGRGVADLLRLLFPDAALPG